MVDVGIENGMPSFANSMWFRAGNHCGNVCPAWFSWEGSLDSVEYDGIFIDCESLFVEVLSWRG